MLLSLISLPPGTPRPSELDFFLSLLHHFQSGWALKWASFTYQEKKWRKKNSNPHRLWEWAVDLLLKALLYLESQIVVLLFLFGPQSIPPLPKNLADCPIVLVWVPLVHQSSMALAENHEGIHWSPDVVLLFLKAKETRIHVSTSIQGNFNVSMCEGYLSRTVLIPIFGQRTKRLSASLHWWCGEGRLWYDSREEAGSRKKQISVRNIYNTAPSQTIKWKYILLYKCHISFPILFIPFLINHFSWS